MPHIIETGPRGERAMDVYSRLLQDRILFLGGPVSDDLVNEIIAQMLWLSRNNQGGQPIKMYINSPGGSVTAGLALYDTMQFIGNVETYCMGCAASMGAVLLAAGQPGHRYILPHSRVMIHQPSQNGGGGMASDIAIQAKEILRMRTQLNGILASHTGLPEEKIAQLTDRDHWMTAEEAKELGMVDHIVTREMMRRPETERGLVSQGLKGGRLVGRGG